MPNYPDYVAERLAHGALCHVCPLNGQRKVGHDGPADAEHIGIAEAPGADEESYGMKYGFKYGRPLVGKTGYFMKIRHLAPNGLVELLPNLRNPLYPKLGRLNIHLMNVAMCRPPDNKIESPEGKRAVRCCANSARWFLNERLRENPNRMIDAMGATALTLVRGQPTKIDPYRGRLLGPQEGLAFPYEDEAEIYKYVLRGKKPREEWWPIVEFTLKKILVAQRAGLRRAAKRLDPGTVLVLSVVKLILSKQRTALGKRAKNEAILRNVFPHVGVGK